MSEPKDRSGSKPGKAFDEAWGSLLDEAADKATAEDGPEGTRAWTEEVRGARKHDADSKDVEAEEPPPRTEKTMAWTEEVRAERKNDASSSDEPAEGEDEMDRLMRAAPVDPAPEEDDIPASASTSAMSFSSLKLPERKPDESLMDAIMGGGDEDEASPKEEASSEDDDEGESPAPEESAADEASARDDETAEEEELPPPIVLHPDRQPTEESPKPKPAEPVIDPPRTKSRLPLFVGGVVAAGLAVWLGRGSSPPPKKDKPSVAEAGPRTKIPTDPAPENPDAGEGKSNAPEPRPASDDPKPERKPPQVDPNRDPRDPPPGTPAEIAAVFKKLPVSPADRAPVGGVGRTGIHIDDVSMGSGYERSRCVGGDGTFSVANDDLANVCIRVVHQRQKEELSVVWQKVEGNARRGKIVVKPSHAYRTRAYLKLRSEYVGDWEVRVFSDDGIELARYPFTIVP